MLRGLSLEAQAGQLLWVRGANGSGKSTLLRALTGLLPWQSGRLRWQGQNIAPQSAVWRQTIGYLGHAHGLLGSLTARAQLPAAALAHFGLAAFADKPVRQLSAGQQRRCALARLVANTAPLWLLDEPDTALDTAHQAHLTRYLQEHLQQGGIILLAAHAAPAITPAHIIELAT